MNADLKRVREASGGTGAEDGMSPSKKRALGSFTSVSSQSQGQDDDDQEDWMKELEVKRKEAIYRQMLEYRRLHREESQRANELEAQKRVLAASMQAVEVCWTQLVSVVQNLTGNQGVEPSFAELTEPVLDPSLSTPELNKALETRLPLTTQLLSNFADLAKNGAKPISSDALHSRCDKLQAESSTLRSRNQTLQAEVSSLSSSRDQLQRDLQKAQKSLDRQRMERDKAERSRWTSEQDGGNATPGGKYTNGGSGHATPNGKMEDDVKPFDPSSTGMLEDTSELEQKAATRLSQLEALRTEHTKLKLEHDKLKIQASSPTEEALRNSPWFQIYLQQLSMQTNRANDMQARFESSEQKLDEMRTKNFEFQQHTQGLARGEVDALRQQAIRKDTDLSRLRGQRDELTAELTERRARESEKITYGEQMEVLANSRQERIVYLTSEVKRLKGRLGAESGSAGYLAFLNGEAGIDGDYVKELERLVSDGEVRANALQKQLDELPAGEHKELAEVRAELEVTRASLAKYEKVLGPNPDVSTEVKSLAERVKEIEQNRDRLQLQLSQADEATNALYTEVENLSKLWEGAQENLSSKAFELKDGELRMSRLATEKAKADNKYFQAMRTKEAIEGECRTAQRSVEKQLRLLERAQEVEKGLNAQIAAHEKGLTALKASSLELQQQLALISSEKTQLDLKLQQAQSSLTEAQQVVKLRVSEHAAEKAAKEKYQEEAETAAQKIKQLKERQDVITAAGSHNVSENELQLKEERNKLFKLLRCSCCGHNMKQQVITKCFHTFCKQCLSDRIVSRQRKCPACGLAFAKEDVSTLYWQ